MRALLICHAVAALVARSKSEGGDAVCAAGGACDTARTPEPSGSPHFWPTARGQQGSYSSSHHAAPFNLTPAFSWRWFHPDGQYHTMSLGCVIDSRRNIYLSGNDGITKHSPDGKLLWNFARPGLTIPTVACLSDGALFGSAHQGKVFSLDLESGEELWSTKVANEIAGDTGFVTTHDGIVIAGAGSKAGERNEQVVALGAADGRRVWNFTPDAPVWNFMALYPGDGTVVFQDLEGRAYRLELHSGRLLWKAGGLPGTWSDGTLMLGPNSAVYTVSSNGSMEVCGNMVTKSWVCSGRVAAYRLRDGSEIWHRDFPRPANSFLAVGRVAGASGLTVVAPIGQQAGFPGFVFLKVLFLPLAVGFGLPCAALFAAAKGLSKRCKAKHRRQIVGSALCGFLGGMLLILAPAILRIGMHRPTYEGALYALDAETGETRWQYELPAWREWHTAGDPEGYSIRQKLGTRALCIPNPFSAPTVGPDGGVYVGYQDGHIYSVADLNNDGHIDNDTEVSTYATGTAFSSPGAAFAPGMLAIANCDGLFVFKS